MSNFDRHLLLCDPVPEGASTTSGWRDAIRGVERIILDKQHLSPWEVGEILAKFPSKVASGQIRSVLTRLPRAP